MLIGKVISLQVGLIENDVTFKSKINSKNALIGKNLGC